MTRARLGALNLLRYAVERPRHGVRPFHISCQRSRGRDVMAKYRPLPIRPGRPLRLDHGLKATDNDDTDAFATASTTPAGTSFQAVPPPSTSTAAHTETPVPAMKPVPPPATDQADAPAEASQTRKEIIVQGVPVPPKPKPPSEEECCMSGCVHCVYNIYADELEVYTEAVNDAREALAAANIPKEEWPDEVQEKSGGEIGVAEKEKLEDAVDPTMAAFLALENKLRKQGS